MTYKELLTYADQLIEEAKLKDNKDKLDVYFVILMRELVNCQDFLNKIYKENRDDFGDFIGNLLYIDKNFPLDFTDEKHESLIFPIRSNPLIYLGDSQRPNETVLDRYRYMMAYYLRLVVCQILLNKTFGYELSYIEEPEIIFNIKEVPLSPRSKRKLPKFELVSIDFAPYISRMRDREDEFMKLVDILTITDDKEIVFKESAKEFFEDNEVEENFDEYYENTLGHLELMDKYLTKAFNDNESAFEVLTMMAKRLDKKFKYELNVKEFKIKYVIAENPLILTDTPLYEGESKMDRYRKIVDAFYRYVHLMDSMNAIFYLFGETTDYDSLSEGTKAMLEDIKEALYKEEDISKMN